MYEELSKWFVESSCSHKGMRQFLGILRSNAHPYLSKNGRHMLGNVEAIEKCGGAYEHFGMLDKIRSHIETNKTESIKLKLHFYGVSFLKSLNTQGWPILCQVNEGAVFLVAIYVGEGKPSCITEFLEDVIEEWKAIRRGIEKDGGKVENSIGSFLCDAPARAFMKNFLGHTECNACERWIVKGEWAQGKCNWISLEKCHWLFQKMYDLHQKDLSPLCEINKLQ